MKSDHFLQDALSLIANSAKYLLKSAEIVKYAETL